jgi:hypothetical protein
MQEEINIFRCLDFIRDNSQAMAQAKANRVYADEFRKSLKAILIQQSTSSTAAGKEADAYAHQSYLNHLEGLRQAVEVEEELRWKMIAAQAKIEVWRSLGANQRAIDKTV